MVIYGIIFIILLISSTVNNRVVFWLNALLLSLLLGFRGITVGVDTVNYFDIYEMIAIYGYEGYPEPLYGYLNYYASCLGWDFFQFQMFMSFLTMFLVCKFIVRNSPRINFSLFLFYGLYYVFYSMNIMRQILSIVVVLYAYEYMRDKRFFKAVMVILSAAMIHLSAIFSMGAFVVKYVAIGWFRFIVITVSSFVVGMMLSESVMTTLLGPYAAYLNSDYGVREDVRILLSIILAIFWNMLSVMIYMTSRRNFLRSMWYRLYFAGIIIGNLMLRLELGLRIVMLFSIAQIIAYPLYVENNIIKQKWIPQLVVILFTSIFFWVFLANNSAGVRPYVLPG